MTESDWKALILQARSHKITPLMWQRLKTLGLSERLPKAARQAISAQLRTIASRNLDHYRELVKLLAELEGKGIEVILLKGLHLAQKVYRNLTLRPMVDMDILVRQEHLAPVQAILLEWGYVPLKQMSIEDCCATSLHLPPLIKVGTINIELHWHIEEPSNPFAIDLDGLWKRAQWWQLGSFKVGGLSPEDLLLHFATHTAYHHFFRIGFIAFFDVAKTIEHYGAVLDWNTLLKRAREWRATRPLFLTLYLAHELVGASVPTTVLKSLEPLEDWQKWVELAKRQLVAGPDRKSKEISTHEKLALAISNVRKRERGGARLQFIRQRLFPARKELVRFYPWLGNTQLVYLFLPYHWLSYLNRYTWPLLQSALLGKRRREVNTKLQQLDPNAQLWRWFTDIKR
ncbi:hypothetical protein PN36_32450 [Candidatus Thiomargarita nelsonii]|uniref:Nucleotidyltransferase family protein n=1 Tax=Candidatus Thiomargarita nelsonii TaxID=1003181 RepID=A0A4E0QMN1_9GAMM|nr:hypothetical protein PN36_32450 [Candidatus Thiomargarita nelsonii]